MKVSFTTKEFARLLELVHLGMRTVMGRQGPEAPHFERYSEVEQKVLGLAEMFGCADLVDVGGDGKLVPSEKLEENERVRKIAGEADNDIFWHELVARLADRDLATEQAKASLSGQPGPPIDTDARLKQLEDGYWQEFETNDLGNILLLKGGRG
jgi:hypothetical protein